MQVGAICQWKFKKNRFQEESFQKNTTCIKENILNQLLHWK